jgi:hypothetical protein
MLKVTRVSGAENTPIPVASSDNNFTSFLARYFKAFPYGRMIDTVVIAVMEDH